ncbi:MAG: tryptophan 2,3-dioxygenase family protein [Pseudomonadota bacterium]
MKKRELESSIHTKLSRDDDYCGYLQLDKLLSAQQPLSDPPHHDEMLFIVQHQVAELWMKLMIHEIDRAIGYFAEDEVAPAIKNLARVRKVQSQLYGMWSVLDTLTPAEYTEFRDVFGTASGFQSPQYRLLEYTLGNKSRSSLKVYAHLPDWHERLFTALRSPGLYDAFLQHLARAGHSIPAHAIERDFSQMRDADAEIVATLARIYDDREKHWAHYEICEALMDINNNFQFWRYHHLKTVERIIGHKAGSGGSSGVGFLKKAIDWDFYPELIRVRTDM